MYWVTLNYFLNLWTSNTREESNNGIKICLRTPYSSLNLFVTTRVDNHTIFPSTFFCHMRPYFGQKFFALHNSKIYPQQKGILSIRMLTKSLLQVRIKVTQSCSCTRAFLASQRTRKTSVRLILDSLKNIRFPADSLFLI